jgi:hypothetical protein
MHVTISNTPLYNGFSSQSYSSYPHKGSSTYTVVTVNMQQANKEPELHFLLPRVAYSFLQAEAKTFTGR